MSIKNKVQLIGNLGNPAEIKELDGGKKVANFSIAVNENYKNKAGEKVENTNWFNVVAWGKTADIIEKFTSKGSKVAIEGSLATRNYEDKDGVKRYVTEITCKEILLLDGKSAESTSTEES